MSFQIKAAGFYQQRSGGKAEVFAERYGWWYGTDTTWSPRAWDRNGRASSVGEHKDDIVAVWHSPPEPPEGFVIQPREYVTREGDKYTYGSPDGWVACPAGLSVCVDFGGYGFIASPIPKPAVETAVDQRRPR